MQTSSNELEGLHPTTRYAAEIVSGLRPSCKREWQACNRHLKDLQRQGAEEFPFVFDESRANRIFDWFERTCRHVRGPFSGELIELLPFQKFDLGCLFGWVHKDSGQRRWVRSFNMRGRGNVKSTEMSGVALYGMCSDCMYPPGHPELRVYEDNPEVECAAVDKEQAKRVWGDAVEMGQKSPDIMKRLDIKKTYVRHQSRSGKLRPLSKETKNKDSGAPCLVIVDEYHAHPDATIVNTLYSGFGKRRQSLLAVITTAGEDAQNSPAKKEYDICCKILDGTIVNERYFVMLRELDENDNPHDEAVWVKANPVLQEDNEYSRNLRDQIRNEHDEAYGSGDPDKIREFLIKRCDRWQADAKRKYMSGIMDRWNALAVPRTELLALVKGRDAWAGADMSKSIDLTADSFVVPLDDGRYAIFAHGFIPENAAKKHEHSDRVPYKAWADTGWCSLTPGDVTDDNFIKAHIMDTELDHSLNIQEVCVDPWGARQFSNDMGAKGYTCVEILQQMGNLSEPTKKLRELTLLGRIVHDGNPLLAWCLSNANEIVDTKGNIMLSKKHKDDSQRIDLAAATINALSRALIAKPVKRSVYEERGPRRL